MATCANDQIFGFSVASLVCNLASSVCGDTMSLSELSLFSLLRLSLCSTLDLFM